SATSPFGLRPAPRRLPPRFTKPNSTCFSRSLFMGITSRFKENDHPDSARFLLLLLLFLNERRSSLRRVQPPMRPHSSRADSAGLCASRRDGEARGRRRRVAPRGRSLRAPQGLRGPRGAARAPPPGATGPSLPLPTLTGPR